MRLFALPNKNDMVGLRRRGRGGSRMTGRLARIVYLTWLSNSRNAIVWTVTRSAGEMFW